MAVGERIGVHVTSVHCFETGRRKPSLTTLAAMAEVYGVDVWRLLCCVALLAPEAGEPTGASYSEMTMWAVLAHDRAKAVRNAASRRSTGSAISDVRTGAGYSEAWWSTWISQLDHGGDDG